MLIGGELEAAGNDDINFSFQKLLIQILEWQTFGMKICELLLIFSFCKIFLVSRKILSRLEESGSFLLPY